MQALLESLDSLLEAPRKRRTAYSSGRREAVGLNAVALVYGRKNKTGRKVSADAAASKGSLSGTPFKSNFRWKK